MSDNQNCRHLKDSAENTAPNFSLRDVLSQRLRYVRIALPVFAMLCSCSTVYERIPIRFRLTAQVNNKDTVYSGSAVIQVTYVVMPDGMVDLGGPDTSPRVSGYALTVNMGSKGLLFLTFDEALRTTQESLKLSDISRSCRLTNIACLPFIAYGVTGKATGGFYSHEKSMLDELIVKRGSREVPFVALPDIEWLPIPHIGTALTRVIPSNISNIDGRGLRLSRVTLELTEDPVTAMPSSWPTWLMSSQYSELRG